jgi:hypothetical protein
VQSASAPEWWTTFRCLQPASWALLDGGDHLRSEQRSNASAQGRIAFAFGIELRRPFLRRLFQDQCKQGFFAIGAHGCCALVLSLTSAAFISSHDGARPK